MHVVQRTSWKKAGKRCIRRMLEDTRLIWKFNRGERDVLHEIYEKYKYELVTLAAAVLCERAAGGDDGGDCAEGAGGVRDCDKHE